MVVLADEILESFFESDLTSSFRLEPVPEAQVPQQKGGFLGGLMSAIVTDDNMKIFNRFADEVGKTIGKHQVSSELQSNSTLATNLTTQVANKPSIGKMDRVVALQEPKARESLLTASMREKQLTGSSSSSSVNVTTQPSETLAELASLTITPSISSPAALAVPTTAPASGDPVPPSPSPLNPLALVSERTAFAIDEAKEEEEDLEDFDDIAEDGLLDEVRVAFLLRSACGLTWDQVDAFLEEHDAGLSAAENNAAKGRYMHVLLSNCVTNMIHRPFER